MWCLIGQFNNNPTCIFSPAPFILWLDKLSIETSKNSAISQLLTEPSASSGSIYWLLEVPSQDILSAGILNRKEDVLHSPSQENFIVLSWFWLGLVPEHKPITVDYFNVLLWLVKLITSSTLERMDAARLEVHGLKTGRGGFPMKTKSTVARRRECPLGSMDSARQTLLQRKFFLR